MRYKNCIYMNLLNEIKKRGMSYSQVAKILDITESQFSFMMLGKRRWILSYEITLSNYFGKSLDYLFKEDYERKYLNKED